MSREEFAAYFVLNCVLLAIVCVLAYHVPQVLLGLVGLLGVFAALYGIGYGISLFIKGK
jgi:hypothetical protein